MLRQAQSPPDSAKPAASEEMANICASYCMIVIQKKLKKKVSNDEGKNRFR